jgi:hypothetical protein
VEILTTSNFSFFIEYDYLGLGNRQNFFTDLEVPPGPPFPLAIKQNVQMILLGANLRFNMPR